MEVDGGGKLGEKEDLTVGVGSKPGAVDGETGRGKGAEAMLS